MRRANEGYTILELMIVVVLMALITALAAPHLSEARANNTLSEATTDTLIIFRRARTEATTQRRAMGIFITKNGDPHLVRLDRGSGTTCDTLPAGCNTTFSTGFGGVDCGVQFLDLQHSHWRRAQVEMNDILIDGATTNEALLCVTPGGQLYDTADDPPSFVSNVEIQFKRASAGFTRSVLVSNTTFPRLML